jgi:hypothetical protein
MKTLDVFFEFFTINLIQQLLEFLVYSLDDIVFKKEKEIKKIVEKEIMVSPIGKKIKFDPDHDPDDFLKSKNLDN